MADRAPDPEANKRVARLPIFKGLLAVGAIRVVGEERDAGATGKREPSDTRLTGAD